MTLDLGTLRFVRLHQNGDGDGDGLTDYEEMRLWRDPTVAEPLPRVATAAETYQAGIRRENAKSEKTRRTIQENREFIRQAQATMKAARLKAQLIRPKAAQRKKDLGILSNALARKSQLEVEAARERLSDLTRDRIGTLRGLDSRGHPVFDQTFNLDFAVAIHAANLWENGSSPLPDLDGSGVPAIGIWDVGVVRTNHVELFGRVSLGETEADIRQEMGLTNPQHTIFRDHPTGVTGTLASSGTNFPERRGMASGVTMLSFHKLHDYAEMGEAALSGMLFSNHSYGTFAGWEAKTTKWRGPYNFSGEDPEFGSYTEDTKVLDALAYLAPHYISVWASGNEVTDDGRIKPDLVANGESILTLGSENANSTSFGSGNGTSYSAPGVTGTLALLQELLTKLGGPNFLSSTWKALLCNTAVDGTILPAYLGTAAENTTLNPAGTNTVNPLTGPDYFFGWGACNALEAAELLTRNSMSGSKTVHLCEHLLVDGSTIEIPICHDGISSEIKAMICWTDPPYQSSSVAGLDDDVTDPEIGPADEDRLVNRRRLMNDLDLRVISPDGLTTYEPWVLNPADNSSNPLKRASPGDNFRDNIEQVIVPAPVAGIYTLRISHKGSLKALQLLTTPVPNSVLPDGAQFQLLSGQSQAVSICISGNKDPSPLFPQLSEPLIINGNLYLELRGHFGVHYELEKSFDLITWTKIPNLTVEVTTFPQAVGPILQVPVAPKVFYRVKSIPASQ